MGGIKEGKSNTDTSANGAHTIGQSAPAITPPDKSKVARGKRGRNTKASAKVQPAEPSSQQDPSAVPGKTETGGYVFPTVVKLGSATLCHVKTGSIVALAVELVGCIIQIIHGAFAWNYPKHQYENDEPATEAILKIIEPAEMLCIVIFDFTGPGLLLISIILAFIAIATSKIKLLIPHAVMQLIFTIGMIVQCFIIVVTPMEYHAELINKARIFDNYVPGHVVPYHKGKLFGICFGIMCMYSVAVLLMIWFILILKHYFFYLYVELGYEIPKDRFPSNPDIPPTEPQQLNVDALEAPQQNDEPGNYYSKEGSEQHPTPRKNSHSGESTNSTSQQGSSSGSYNNSTISKGEDEVTRIALEPPSSIPSTPVDNSREVSPRAVRRKKQGDVEKESAEM